VSVRMRTSRLPMEVETSKSDIGVHVVPPLVVYQTPPSAKPARMKFVFVGWTQRAVARP